MWYLHLPFCARRGVACLAQLGSAGWVQGAMVITYMELAVSLML